MNNPLINRPMYPALKAWGWQAYTHKERAGFAFPLWNEAGEVLTEKKWKADDGQKPKNAMLFSRPAFDYYMPPKALEAIKSSAEIWLAEGETDVATLHMLGIRNAICWLFGATSIPANLADDLKRWGVYQVNYCPDLDEAGYKSALDLLALLADKRFKVKIRRVGGEIGTGNDLSDMFSTGKFNPRQLAVWSEDELRALTETKPLNPDKRLPAMPMVKADGTLNPRLLDELERVALAQAGGKPTVRIDGRLAIPVLSVYSHKHDEAGEHAYYFPENHSYYDWGKGDGWLGAKDLVEYWKINVEALGGWYLQETKALTRPTSQVAETAAPSDQPADLFITQSQVMQDWQAYFEDLNARPNIAIMRNPFPHLRAFGGFAKFLTEGMVMLILGTTGGKKSVLLENLLDHLIYDGNTGVLIGGEWTPHNSGLKAIQRFGGASMDAMFEDMVARQLKSQGRDGVAWDAKALTDYERQETVKIARTLGQASANGAGEIIHYNAKYSQTPFSKMLEQVAREIHLNRQLGRKVSWVAVDYAQFYTDENNYKGQNVPEHILTAFKLFCVNMRVVGIMTSQITKSAQKDSNAGEKIDIADGLGLRSDKANLVVAIENVWAGGKVLPYKKITIAKNSLGRTDYFYLHDAPGGNHLQFQLEGAGIADKMIVEALIYQAKQEATATQYPQTPK